MSARSRLGAVALVAAVSTTSACIDIVADTNWFVEHEAKQFQVTGVPDVSVSTFEGPIEVRTWDRPEVEVEIEKRASDAAALKDIAVDARQEGNRVVVEVRNTARPGGSVFDLGRTRAALVVSLPRAANLEAKSHDGAIDVARIAGRVRLWSGDGSIRARDISGEITVQTGDGSVRFDGVDGVVDVQSGDGSVVVDGALDGLRVRTGDGSVTIHATAAAPSREWDVNTGDGSVTLEVPAGFGAELDAHTGDGRIRLDGVSVARDTDQSRRNVRATIGGGGPLVRLRTGDGSIRVVSR